MQVIILCAGMGTRLFPISNFLPKSLIPVGNKPCIRWIVDRIKSQGFDDLSLRVNAKDAPLFEHEFRDVPVKLSYGIAPLGTAGELLAMYEEGEITGSEFIVYYGDELTQIDLKKLVRFHESFRHPCVTLALVHGMRLDVGTVSIDDEGTVLSFEEKPPLDKAIWSGICVITKKIFKDGWMQANTDLAADIFPKMLQKQRLQKQQLIKGAILSTEWLDIGTISHWERANKLALEGKLECGSP